MKVDLLRDFYLKAAMLLAPRAEQIIPEVVECSTFRSESTQDDDKFSSWKVSGRLETA